jgi:hypothetical protein
MLCPSPKSFVSEEIIKASKPHNFNTAVLLFTSVFITKTSMSLWVRCTRSFLLWSPAQLDDFYAIVMMIVNNLRTFPLERKYQELKFSNSQIQNRILKRSGGMEFMQAIGFQIQSKEDQKYFIFQEDYFQELDGSLSWLRFCSPSPCPGPTLFLPPSLPPFPPFFLFE